MPPKPAKRPRPRRAPADADVGPVRRPGTAGAAREPGPKIRPDAPVGATLAGAARRAPARGAAGSALRVVPTQERSRRRLETILDAAATLFSDQGYEAVTVDAIAKSAGTPIGSVYQFFKDKRAVFTALAERAYERTDEAFEVLVRATQSEPRPPWPVMLDAVIDGFAVLAMRDPTFRAMNRNVGHADLEAEALVHQSLCARTSSILALYAPRIDRETRDLVATTLVDSVTFTFVLGELRDRSTAQKLLAETKTMLRLYVEGRLGMES